MARTAIAIGVAAMVFAGWGATAAELTPHRAFYSASIASAKAGTGISRVDGGYAVELERSCDGWIVGQQLTAKIVIADGRALAMDARFTAWESLDGRAYRFSVREQLGQQEKRFKGEASMGARAGVAHFSVPAAAEIALPAGTLFPVGHMATLIDHAILGETSLSVPVFDGSDGQAPRRVTAFIARQKPPGAGATGLAARPRWPVRLAYFAMDANAAMPEFEVESDMLDNGVAGRLLMDFGDFSIRLDLTSVEPLPMPKC